MFFTKLGLFLPFFFLFAWRWSRWLAYLQQKEYRVDRFWRFLQSTQGRQELKKLLPKPIELTRTGWKRPVITARLLVAVVLNILLWLGISSVFFNHTLVVFCLGLLAVYVLVSIVVFVSAWPTAIASAAITWWMLYRAQQLLRRAHPFIIGVGGSYCNT